ncbi:MAG TPA: LLM class flavin-dependent oxidoreductase [Actinopolymorphaceae bacterium]
MNTEDLGRVGVWLPLHHLPVETGRRIAVRVEDQGYGSLWGGEVIGGQEAFALYGTLLAATRRLVVGTGIATIWARPSATARAGAATLAEAYPGRFVLGLGTGNPTQAAQVGESYGQPLDRMRDYLAGLRREDDPEPAFPTVLAALGPRMLDLARDRADGAHTFLTLSSTRHSPGNDSGRTSC